MLERLNHVAIAVPDLNLAGTLYRDTLGAKVSEVVELPAHGVSVLFVELNNSKLELLHPLGTMSPISKFLEDNPGGGIHHICYDVEDIVSSLNYLKQKGMRVLGDGRPKEGAHGKPVVFLHPKDFCGTLIELEQI